MRSERTRLIVEVALTVALCAALKLWRIHLPWNFAGGDVSLEMLPILVLSIRRGLVAGVTAGAIWGVLVFFFEPYPPVHWVQYLLDYPVAYAALGITGLGSAQWRRLSAAGRRAAADAVSVPWMLLGGSARFAAAFASGVVFFGANAPAGQPVLLYSALYNLSYIVPSLAMSIVAALVLLPVLERAVPVAGVARPPVAS
jgi:thiamine transporter